MGALVKFTKLLVLVLSVLVMSIGSSAQAGVIATVREDISLRVGAGTQWRRVTILPAGTTVALDGRISNSTWVRGIASDGQNGWMATSFLTVDMNAVATLPVIAREAPLTVPAPAQGTAPTGNVPADGGNSGGGASGGVAAQATANVNMRSGPSTEYRRVGGVNQGGALSLDGRNPGITWVRGINSQGEVGWVSVDFINLNFDQVAALPIVAVGSPFNLAAPGGGAPAAPAQPEAAAAVNVQPIISTAPVTGFSHGGHVQSLSGTTVNAMRQAGMTWVKKQVRYNLGNSPDGWSAAINEAHGNGFRILLGVVGSPQQVNQGGFDEQYAGFVAGLAALGADAIEIWNEPNLDREWPTGQIDPGRYTQLLATSYNAIKNVNSNTMVISGAPAPTGFFGGCGPNGCDDAAYIAGMAAAGAARYMDCVGVHYNEGIIPPSQNSGDPRSEHYTRYYNSMVNTYYNTFRKPLCFTEIGYLSPEGYGPLPGGFAWAANTSVAEHAAWLGQAKRMARNSGIVRLFIVWNVDFQFYGDDPMGGYAIIRPDGSCPACSELAR